MLIPPVKGIIFNTIMNVIGVYKRLATISGSVYDKRSIDGVIVFFFFTRTVVIKISININILIPPVKGIIFNTIMNVIAVYKRLETISGSAYDKRSIDGVLYIFFFYSNSCDQNFHKFKYANLASKRDHFQHYY